MSITRDDKLFRSKVPWIVAGLMNEFATITAQLANIADSMTLLSYTIEFIPGV